MWTKGLTAPFYHCKPSRTASKAPLKALKAVHASTHSPSRVKQGMFSNGPNHFADQSLGADDPYADNVFQRTDQEPQTSERRTGKKQRWRKLKNRDGSLETGVGNEEHGHSEEESLYSFTANTDDTWRIRNKPTYDRKLPYPESSLSENVTYHQQVSHSSRPHLPLHHPTHTSPTHLPRSQLSPSSEYISIASSSSTPLTENAPRKLLILDLNGTLLVRVSARGAIYSRPYMPSFRAYLFAEQTQAWLDTMVWSSAQPHNVDRMVSRVFFDEPPPPHWLPRENGRSEKRWEGKLQAVWARDTLGLSTADYSRKSATTKDMNKVWTALPGNHSAQTTLLLDDSPDKVRLQPYNHICISEYSLHARDHDFELKRSGLLKSVEKVTVTSPALPSKNPAVEETTRESASEVEREVPDVQKDASLPLQSLAKEVTTPTLPPNLGSNSSPKIEEKPITDTFRASPDHTLSKTLLPSHEDQPPSTTTSTYLYSTPSIKLSTSLPGKPQQTTTVTSFASLNVNDAEAWHSKRETTDETLLAVIGILDTLKNESNVAGWIHAGGLWAGHAPQIEASRSIPSALAGSMGSAGAGSTDANTDSLTTFERPPSPTDLEVEDLLFPQTDVKSAPETLPQSIGPSKRQLSHGSSNPGDDGSGSPKRTKTGVDTFAPSSFYEHDVAGHDYKEEIVSIQKNTSVENTKTEDPEPFVIPGFRFTNGLSNDNPNSINETIPAGNDAETLGVKDQLSSPPIDDDFVIPGLNLINYRSRSSSSVHQTPQPEAPLPVPQAPEASSTNPTRHKQIQKPAHTHMKMWYGDPEVFAHWVKRGRDALHSLGIKEDDGVKLI